MCVYIYIKGKKPMNVTSFGGPSLGGIGAPETGKHAWIHWQQLGKSC